MKTPAHIATALLDNEETAKQFLQRKVSVNWWDVLERNGYVIEQSTGFKGKPHYLARKYLHGEFNAQGRRGWNSYVRVFPAIRQDSLHWVCTINLGSSLHWYCDFNQARSTARRLERCTSELDPVRLRERVKKEFNASTGA